MRASEVRPSSPFPCVQCGPGDPQSASDAPFSELSASMWLLIYGTLTVSMLVWCFTGGLLFVMEDA